MDQGSARGDRSVPQTRLRSVRRRAQASDVARCARPDGKSCIYDGLSVPIGPHFFWNKAHTRLCNDEALTDCFLHRTSARAEWLPVHPLLVQNDCFAYWQGSPWMRVGTPTPDGQGCENRGHVIPIGYELKQDRHHDSFYCYDEPDKAANQTQKKWCLERPDKPQSTSDYLMRRWAGGVDNSIAALKKGDDKVRQGSTRWRWERRCTRLHQRARRNRSGRRS